MEVGSSQEVGELGTVVGMLFPVTLTFVFMEILKYISGEKKEIVGLWEVIDGKKKKVWVKM